jgi:ribose transport system substrate-binding protein
MGMKLARRLAVTAGLAATVALAAGCGSSDSGADSGAASSSAGGADKPVRIGVFIGDMSNSYEAAELDGIKAGAKEFGGEVVQVFDGKFDGPTQVNQLQDAITSGKYDAFAISVNDGGAVTPQIRNAIKANIKVACMLTPCGPDPVSAKNQIPGMTTNIGFPFADNGAMLGELVVKACADRDPCNLVYMPGLYTLPGDKARLQGLKGVLAKHPNIKVVAQQEGKYDTGTARSVMQNILTANHDVHVVATAYDTMTSGVEQAVKDAGLAGKVALIGSGGGAIGIKAVADKRWFGTVAAIPQTEGKLAAKHLIAAVRGKGQGIPDWINEYELEEGGPVITQDRAATFKAEWAG